MRTRLLTALTLGIVAVVLGVGPVAADDRPGEGGGAYVDGGGNPTATATEGGTPGAGSGGGGGGGSGPPCHWEVIIEDDFVQGMYSVDTLETQHSATGRWLQYWCDGYGVTDVNGFYATPEGGLVDPEALAQEALASAAIAPPAIRTSPSEHGKLFVQVPTWLWLDRAWWHSYTATASTGRVWSTVTARPVSVSWKLGDGTTVSCTGAGTEWTAGAPEDGSDCRHTYRRSSAESRGGTFAMVATVRLEVTWTSNAPFGGTLPAISRTSSLDVEVGEIQAIGTRGGS